MQGSREIRLARSMLLEAMLLGAAMTDGADSQRIQEALTSEKMTAATGRHLLAAIKDKDKKRFAKIMESRYGVTIKKDERALDGLLRGVMLRQSSEATREMVSLLLESVNQSDNFGDVAEKLEECLEALRSVAKLEESLQDKE